MPGCTGLWQVIRRNEADFDEMVWLDIVYINHSGILEDLKLIIKTIGGLFILMEHIKEYIFYESLFSWV